MNQPRQRNENGKHDIQRGARKMTDHELTMFRFSLAIQRVFALVPESDRLEFFKRFWALLIAFAQW